MQPGFSERTFEFCFNAEFCRNFGGLLVSHPYIPSQYAEKDLGYDVEFRIQHGKYTGSIFLQHKISHYAAKLAGLNAQFYNHHGGPYFRFTIDNDQHNTLYDLSTSNGNAYYCAPLFHLRRELEAHFWSGDVASSVSFLDPVDVGEVYDDERHNVTYGPSGEDPALHSETRRFKKSYRAKADEPPPITRRDDIDVNFVESLSQKLRARTLDSKFRRSITKEVDEMRPVQRAQYILGRIYGVSWILVA